MGTEDALLKVTGKKIYNSLNSYNRITGLLTHFKTAFDLVGHSILLSKLEVAGIRGTTLDWCRSFLPEFKQSEFADQFSKPLTIKAYVPQGSVLSAMLLLVFLNELIHLTFHGCESAFADDVALIYFEESVDKQTNICKDLEMV